MPQNTPRLNNVTIEDLRFGTHTQNKGFGVTVQGRPQTKRQKRYTSAETPVRFNDACWTPKQDCAWFLANIAKTAFVASCELGDADIITPTTELRCYGVLTYQIGAGVAMRGGMTFDTEGIADPWEITTAITYLAPNVIEEPIATTYIF